MLCSQMSRTMEILGMFCLLWVIPDAINPFFWNRLWFGQDRGIEIVHPTQNFLKLFCFFVDQQGHWALCMWIQKPAYYSKCLTLWLILATPELQTSWWTLFDFFGFAFITVTLWSVKTESHKPLIWAGDHFCLQIAESTWRQRRVCPITSQ